MVLNHTITSLLGTILQAINWGTPLYLLALYGPVKSAIRHFYKPRDQEELKRGQINWTPLEAISFTLAIYFGAQIIGGLLAYAYPLIRGWSAQQIESWFSNNIYGQFFLVVVIEGLTIWLLYKFLKGRRANFRTIGLNRKPKWLDLGYVLLGFGAYFLLYVVAVNVVKALTPHLNLDQQQQIGFEGARNIQLFFVFASLVVLPPFIEELLVRGFLYTGLKNKLPMIWAVLITGTLFAVAHLQAGSGVSLLWVAAIDTFILSTVLIYLKEKTGSLWASIGLHMLKNCLAFLSIFVFHLV